MRLIPYLILQICFSISLHGTRPVVSLFADKEGASAFVIGLLVSFFALLPMLLAIQIGKWVDTYGPRLVCYIGMLGLAVSLAVPAVHPGLPTLFFSQIVMGISHLSCLVAVQKTVGNLPGNRDKTIAWVSLCGSIGELIGPLISGFTFQYLGFSITFTVYFFFIITALIVGLSVSSRWKRVTPLRLSRKGKKVTGSAFGMLRQVNLRNALIVSGLVLYSKDLFIAYFPVYASNKGMDESMIGIILSLMALMAITVRLIQFKLVERFGRGKVLTTTLLMSAAAYVLVPFNQETVILTLLAMMMGAGLGLGQPLSLVYAINVSPRDRQGEVLGMRLTINRASQFVAPFVFGAVGSFAGLSPVFWVSGIFLLIGATTTRIKDEYPDKEKQRENDGQSGG